jgi:hypothetical protein
LASGDRTIGEPDEVAGHCHPQDSLLQRLDAVLACISQLEAEVAQLRADISPPNSTALPADAESPQPQAVSPAPSGLPVGFDSVIIPDFPEIFSESSTKWFSLLWLGSSNSFQPWAFHHHYQGRANTLTAVLDTEGSTFRGFTTVEWESRD